MSSVVKIGTLIRVREDAFRTHDSPRTKSSGACVTAGKEYRVLAIYPRPDADCVEYYVALDDNGYPQYLFRHEFDVVPSALTEFQRVGRLIKEERRRQDAKFGPQGNLGNMTSAERMMVLTEEVGELAQALNDARQATTDAEALADLEHARQELIEVAAVAVAWAEVLESGGIDA